MNSHKHETTRLPALAAVTLVLLASLPAVAPATPSTAAGESWRFDVFLDDREIGFHEFRAAGIDGGLRLTSEARFEVKVLFITAFDYAHENTEFWRDGCLQRIEARTRTNGDNFQVSGRSVGDRFDVQTRDGSSSLTDCVSTFAYWDRDRLLRQQLLNSQTGKYVDVDFDTLAPGTVRIDNVEIPVERYRLSAEGMDITLAYAQTTGEWVALDSTVKGGRTLRYRRDAAELHSIPAVAAGGISVSTGAFK